MDLLELQRTEQSDVRLFSVLFSTRSLEYTSTLIKNEIGDRVGKEEDVTVVFVRDSDRQSRLFSKLPPNRQQLFSKTGWRRTSGKHSHRQIATFELAVEAPGLLAVL